MNSGNKLTIQNVFTTLLDNYKFNFTIQYDQNNIRYKAERQAGQAIAQWFHRVYTNS